MHDPIRTASQAGELQFVDCHGHALTATNETAAQPGGGARRQVIVAGKRVKTIDVHAHCVIPKALELQGKDHNKERGPGLGDVGLRRIREMDEQGIDVEAISINPHWYKAERDLAVEICKINNETLAELCAAHPDRFVGFAALTLQAPDVAVQQLEHAVKKLGMRGAAIGGSVAGDEFANAKFDAVWRKAEELGVLPSTVFIK